LTSRGFFPIDYAKLFATEFSSDIEVYSRTSYILGALSLGCVVGGLILGKTARSVLSFKTLAFNFALNLLCLTLYCLFYDDVFFRFIIIWENNL